jgi:hypothetical protein
MIMFHLGRVEFRHFGYGESADAATLRVTRYVLKVFAPVFYAGFQNHLFCPSLNRQLGQEASIDNDGSTVIKLFLCSLYCLLAAKD